MGDLAGTNGIPMRRVYVGVTVEYDPCGDERPVRVTWIDGRSWTVESVYSVRSYGRAHMGNLVTRFDVRIAGRRKSLWRQGTRWFVAPPAAPSAPVQGTGVK
ncbi:hypothetical protein Corgl_1406 [Coriobacterium glomerans PW2]|uniref:Uncharacterized protein n=1 Tax=Coriobacterium glomerans (strain ATCC 49209 / DSM 20642 / JCM 10262 / PW2) TaxID=700015 RepID=F2NAQ1_CORGP|nr:hypothetical protein [Coriobacterium glomerans]AEB07507.1 hypothetical protein Corgl_1406 [Coriobacterium glomerans PW2]